MDEEAGASHETLGFELDVEPFCVGDQVSLKGHGRAVVVEPRQSDKSQPFHNRVQIQYPDGKTYWANPSKLRRIRTAPTRVIAAETTKQYREAAMRYVNSDDVCLEVGCHEGITTAKLHARCHFIVGVDMSEKTVNIAKAKFPHVRFETADGADIELLKTLSPTGVFDKVLLDIGGIAQLPVVMSLVGQYYRTWRNAVIIVKSIFFARLLQDAGVYEPSGGCLSSSAAEAVAKRHYWHQQNVAGVAGPQAHASGSSSQQPSGSVQ